jgi:hypothetical protein
MGALKYSSTVPDLGTTYRQVSGQLHSPVALPPGNSHGYSMYRRVGGLQSRSGCYGEMKRIS